MDVMLAPMNFKFALSVATVCCDDKPGETPDSIAQYVQRILDRLFNGSMLKASVSPIAYPTSSKCPLVININDQWKRLLWYYPGMKPLSLSDELFDLLYDVIFDPVAAMA